MGIAFKLRALFNFVVCIFALLDDYRREELMISIVLGMFLLFSILFYTDSTPVILYNHIAVKLLLIETETSEKKLRWSYPPKAAQIEFVDMNEQMTWAMTTKTGSTVQSNTIDSISHPFVAEVEEEIVSAIDLSA